MIVLFALLASTADAQADADDDTDTFDVMSLLHDHGLHDFDGELWNVYGQFTYISNLQLPFHAPYTNAGGSINSLRPGLQHSFTGTFTLFFGLALWRGAEAYFSPEMVSERPLSELKGLGASVQNFELQKGGTPTPLLYRARTFLRQTIELGGQRLERESGPLQLAGRPSQRRLVITLGSFSLLDVFDHNNVVGDPRQTFVNIAMMTHAAWDFPAEGRGYSWGATAELDWDDWALRIGRITPPLHPNQIEPDFHFWRVYGDQLELEHDHVLFGQPGAVRLLGYRNRVQSARFDQTIAAFEADPQKNATTCPGFSFESQNANAPDLCWARKPNVKVGIGINIEQYVAPGIGVVLRAMYADGRTEVVEMSAADRSLSLGVVAHGVLWQRPLDVAGVGYASAWISAIHARYLALGGVDGYVGDGRLRPTAEQAFDVFYSVNLFHALWVSADYQLVSGPAFNADRGPVQFVSGRVHAEF